MVLNDTSHIYFPVLPLRRCFLICQCLPPHHRLAPTNTAWRETLANHPKSLGVSQYWLVLQILAPGPVSQTKADSVSWGTQGGTDEWQGHNSETALGSLAPFFPTWHPRGWSHHTVRRVVALNAADMGLIPGTLYGPKSRQEWPWAQSQE